MQQCFSDKVAYRGKTSRGLGSVAPTPIVKNSQFFGEIVLATHIFVKQFWRISCNSLFDCCFLHRILSGFVESGKIR